MDLELPFLIEHGGWLWVAAMVAISSAVWAAVALGRRLRARRELRGVMERIRAWHPREGEVIVRGVLGAGAPGVVIARVHTDGKGEPSFEWQREAWIESAEGKVQLAGEVMMLAGAMSAARFGVPRRTPDAMLKQHIALHRPRRGASIQWATLTALATGDEVIARGRIERRPQAQDGDYREGPHVALLHAMGDADPRDARIELAATAPRAVPRPMRLGAVVALAVALPLAVFLGIHVAGGRSVEACREQLRGDHPLAPITLGALDACAVAAAAPNTRGEVLRALASRRSAWSCARVEVELASARLDGAAAAAEACGDDSRRARVMVAAGRFSDAARVLSEGGLLWIAAGSWTEAARATEARLAALADEPRKLAYARCFADLLHHRAGDPAAADRLRQRRAGAEGDACAPFAAQLAAPAERVEILRDVDLERAIAPSNHWISLVEALRWRYGLHAPGLLERGSPAFGLEMLGMETRVAVPPALIALVAGHVPDEPSAGEGYRIHTLEWQAVRSVLRGNSQAAALQAKRAAELRATLDPSLHPGMDRPSRLLAVLPWFGAPSDGASVVELATDGYQLRSGLAQALREAAAGSGERLASVLAAPAMWWHDADLLQVTQRLRTGKAQIREVLAQRLPVNLNLLWVDPLVIASSAVVREQLFRALDAPEAAARWRRIADTVLAAVDDEDRLFAMWAWAELGW